MAIESGNISVQTENIFPIIKKWLYSDQDIFLRELVSNANDAITKYNKLVSIGEAKYVENEKFSIKVNVNRDNNTMQIIDNGIGMTAEEVKKYINQIAFSGVQDFFEKYKGKIDEGSQIIGHFGLGFYSAFMVADKVEIDTLSYVDNAEAVKWVCEGGIKYEMDKSDKTDRGTVITLYMSDDCKSFLDSYKTKSILEKYCAFLPIEIYFEDLTKAKDDKEKKDNDKNEENKPINDIHPLWIKQPKDCTDQEYKDFYKKVFNDYDDPLFWIHLNVDYPFNLKGILYFPKLKPGMQSFEGQIKLFYNQVFVADNIKEVIPEFLLLLKGVIDCPDLPLNVSRSALQNNGYVRKISDHITKKVADKLEYLFKNERDNYNKYWDDISPFIKYGCMRDSKFHDQIKDIIIYKTINDDYVTLKEYLDKNKEKQGNNVFYVNDPKQQVQYINMFKDNGLDAVILPSPIDASFIQFVEIDNKDVKFKCIDSDISSSLVDKTEDKDDNASKDIEKIFKDSLSDDKLKIKVENLVTDDVPAIMLMDEQSRRMQQMSIMLGGQNFDSIPKENTLVINKKNNIIKTICSWKDDDTKKENMKLYCKQIYDLAVMGQRQLSAEEMTSFINRSNTLLGLMGNK